MNRVRDYSKRPDIKQAVEDARDTIISCWNDWEAEAGQDAQEEQSNDAWFDTMQGQLECVLLGMLDQIDGIDEAPSGLGRQEEGTR